MKPLSVFITEKLNKSKIVSNKIIRYFSNLSKELPNEDAITLTKETFELSDTHRRENITCDTAPHVTVYFDIETKTLCFRLITVNPTNSKLIDGMDFRYNDGYLKQTWMTAFRDIIAFDNGNSTHPSLSAKCDYDIFRNFINKMLNSNHVDFGKKTIIKGIKDSEEYAINIIHNL